MFIVPKNVQNRLARIPAELRIVRYEAHENCDEIFVEIPKPEIQECPHCGSGHCVIKDQGRMRTVRHIRYFVFKELVKVFLVRPSFLAHCPVCEVS